MVKKFILLVLYLIILIPTVLHAQILLVESKYDFGDIEKRFEDIKSRILFNEIIEEHKEIEPKIIEASELDNNYGLLAGALNKQSFNNLGILTVNERINNSTGIDIHWISNPKETLKYLKKDKQVRKDSNDKLTALVENRLKHLEKKLDKYGEIIIRISVKNSFYPVDSLAVPLNDKNYIGEAVYRIYSKEECIYSGYYFQPNTRGGSMAAFRAVEGIYKVADVISNDIYRQVRNRL